MENHKNILYFEKYFKSKISNISDEVVQIDRNRIELIDLTLSKINILILIEEDERIICCLDDLEIIDEYEGDITEIVKYLDHIISNTIVKFDEFCNENLVKRHYRFSQKLNGKIELINLFSINKFTFLCDKKMIVKEYIPW